MDRPAVASVFAVIDSPSTFEETVARLGRAIRLGVLEPGTRLPPERELAEQLGISRSTLRQALRTLTQTGHLTAQRGRSGGTFVAADPPMNAGGRDVTGWRDLLDRRMAIELGSVHLAAERGDDETFDHLAEHIAVMRTSVEDWRAFRRSDVLFHLGIAEAAQSPWLVREMTDVHAEYSELLDIAPYPSSVLEHGADQHAHILAALRRRDSDDALRCMIVHVRGSEALFEGLNPAV